MGLTLVTAPAGEPITLAEARDQLRLITSGSPAVHADDAYVTALIATARQHIDGRDGWLGRALVEQTWDYVIDDFPSGDDPISIPLPPLVSVDSVKYIDTDGVEQTLSDSVYDADTGRVPGRLYLAYNQSWPSVRDQRNAVSIRFTAGYPATSSPIVNHGENVPTPMVAAMKLMIAHWYENREAVIIGTATSELPMAVESLLGPYRVRGFY